MATRNLNQNEHDAMHTHVHFGYCIVHEREVVISSYHREPYHVIEIRSDGIRIPDVKVCYGEFAYCPPPEVTEEEWDFIFSNEEGNNASEVF